MKFKIVAALSIASLALVACGDGGGDAGGPDVDASGSPESVLTVTTGQGAIPQLDPGLATFQWERVLNTLLWDGLTEINEEGEVVGGLAETWSANDDFTEWTFVLRDGVTFSDGRDLTAEDVVWNVERYLSDTSSSIAKRYLAAVEDTTAISETEVQLTLSEPDSVLPHGLSTARIIDPNSEDEINSKPIGTGPFVVENFVPNQTLTMARNDDYWGEKADVGTIEIITTNDTSAAVTALRSADVDVLWNLPTADAAPLEDSGGISLYEAEQSTQMHYLSLDTTSPPFDDPAARLALSLLLDRQTTVDVAYTGFGEPATYNNLISKANWAFDETNLENQDLDLERAAELFEQAGVTAGDSLTWWGLGGAYPEWNSEAQLLQERLASIDIELVIENQESGTWVEKFIPKPKQYPGLIIPNAGGDLNDPAYMYGRLVDSSCECNWNSEKYNELALQGVLTDDESERAEIYGQMQAIVTEELPILISVHTPMITAARSEVSGIWVAPSGDLRLEGAAIGTE